MFKNVILNSSFSMLVNNIKNDVLLGTEFHSYLIEVTKPVFKKLAHRDANKYTYETIYLEIVNDIFLYVLDNGNKVYTNFESFVRKRFEFLYLNHMLRINRIYKNTILFNEEVEITIRRARSYTLYEKLYEDEKYDAIIEYVSTNKDIFNMNEVLIVKDFASGYNLYEISKLNGFSYGKTKSIFEGAITKIKNIYFREIDSIDMNTISNIGE